MNDLVRFCKESNNDMDHRQARILRAFLIASLLGGDVSDVRFFNKDGICFRHASFSWY